jgi:vacuolar-type H+-ATPase subunit F/Vma7
MDVAVLADEITATGWRLCGAAVIVPEPDRAQIAFDQALESAQFVLVTQEFAQWLDPAGLARALDGTEPLVLIIEDLRGRMAPPHIEHLVRRGLGIET